MTGQDVMLDAERPTFDTLVERFAAARFTLEVNAPAREWRVSGAGGTRTFYSRAEAEGFLERQGRSA